MANNGCGQLGAIQTRGTCWFYSILNGFILSEDGQKILYNKLKKFHKKLKPAEKIYFDDKFNAPCPMKNLSKTKEIYFWKFIDQYLCFMSGPREASLKAGKSASLLGGLSLQGTIAKEHKGGKGAYPQVEIQKILDHVGFKGDYYVKYADDSHKFHMLRKPQFVVVMQNKYYPKTYMDKIPAGLIEDPKYELMCASLVIANTYADKNEEHRWHALAGFKCGGKGYIYDSNQRKIFKCNWWNRIDFINVVDTEVAEAYAFFKGGQINVHQYAFAIFARKEFTKDIGLACLRKYKTKTPEGYNHLNFTSPNLGRRLNNINKFSWLKPAERAALKRKWGRTEHKKIEYLNKATYNSLLNSAKNVNSGYKNLMALKNAGYGVRNDDYKNFMTKLEKKFKSVSPKKYTFTEAKVHLNQFSTSGKAVRQHQYSFVWRGIPMAQRKVLMHWRNTGNWLANNAFEEKAKPPIKRKPKPKSASPETKRRNKLISNFKAYWSALTSENRQTLRNWNNSQFQSPGRAKPSPTRYTLENAKRNVNALKTAKARKEYKRARAVNMGAPNWKELGRYINQKNADASKARAAKKSLAKK
jgi:hypothetical protein